ncbi:MAG: efflux RND transporter permease subunit [Elainellaceae cyanobacterium]
MLLSISDTFIRRPVLTTVCSLLILLAGIVAIPLLPIAQLPDIAPPQVQVQANYIGADAETVENTVTTILEREINGVEGMQYMTSSSSNDGTSSITVTFDPDRDKDQAQVDVQNRVSTAEPNLPDAVLQTGVTTEKTSNTILLVYGILSEDETYDSIFLSNYVDLFIFDELKRIDGVGQVQIFGERQYAMRLWLDPNALASRDLTADDVASALREQNIQVGLGAIGAEPNPNEQSYEFTLRVQGRLEDASEFENLVLKVADDGTLIKLKDVGRAELGAENYNSNVRITSSPGVGIGIYQLPGSNALDVANGVKARMAELEQNFPPGMEARVAFDTTEFVTQSLSEVVTTLVLAVALVILIIFIFLQDWRATVIPSIAIPVALIGTMALLLAFGFSINTLTLFGCVLATGLVVDDGIIVVEAIASKLEQGMKPRQAALDCMNELASAVVSTSLVLMAVFIPVAFFPGTTGKIYQQFALTIAFAVAISTFNALSFSPSISAILLRRRREGDRHGPLGWFFGRFNRGFGWVTRQYRHAIDRLVHMKWLVMAIFAGLLVLTAFMYRFVPSGFVPEEDQGYFIGIVQAPEGVSVDYTQEVMDRIDTRLQEVPEVRSTFMITGFSFEGSSPNRGLFFASLKNWSERQGPGSSAQAVIGRLSQEFFQIQEAIVVVFNAPPVQGLSSFGGFEFQLLDQSGGQLSIEELVGSAYQIIGAANQSPAVSQVFTQFTAGTPQIQLDIDRDRLQALNVDFNEALTTLGAYLGSQYVNDFTLGPRNYRVYIQADSEFRSQPEDIGQIYVRSRDDRMIPLNEIVTTRQISGPQVINHFNIFRSILIQGSSSPGFSTGEAIAAMEQSYQQVAQPVLGQAWQGTARQEEESGGQAPLIFGLGLVVVFLVLAAQYESYIDPIIIMLTVPLALLGALAFLWARGLNLDVYAQVGMVMLIGLASKNAILIVEYANQAREQGMSISRAAIDAAEQRFRPILMTAISSLVGFFPLVIATGAGSASRWSLGTVVFGGLLIATFLSLLVVPVTYIVIKSLEAKAFSDTKDDRDSGPHEPPQSPQPSSTGESVQPDSERQPTPRIREGDTPA